jgi:uncharacterized protein (DUF1800 family)
VSYKPSGVRRIRRARKSRASFVVATLTAWTWLGAALPAFAQAGTSYFTVTPCRVLDTRNAIDPNGFGGPALAAASTRVFNLAGQCGISTGAQAVSANVTVVGPAAPGFLTFYPAGGSLPLAATINYSANQVRTNNAVLALGANGGVACAAVLGSGTVDVIVDVTGYFADPGVDTTKVAPPVLSPPPGTYNGTQLVSLATSTPGAQIRYTTDGSVPTSTTGTLYTGAFALANTATVQAIAFATGKTDSPVDSGTYTITHLPTLYIATMTPQGAALSTGAGQATLLVAGDETSAVFRFTYSNLTTPVTSQHIHGPGGPGVSAGILFDIDASPKQADGSYIWTFVPVGTNTVAQIVSYIKTGLTYINIHTSTYPSGEIRGQFVLANGTSSFTPPPPPPPLPPGPPTARDAARFLQQATFGPTLSEISSLQTTGFDTWLSQQFAQPLVSHAAYLDAAVAAGEILSANQVMESFWKQAATGPDALRQRVALALSEIFVISDENGILHNNPFSLAAYYDVLENDAFGNFRTLLEDVTLSPAMGTYLNMLGNDKENLTTGQNPNENYAREILQLFSIGLLKLNPDGTLLLDGTTGLPIPTYDQDVVIGFAHVFTGWSFGGDDTTKPSRFFHPTVNYRIPMANWPSHHSTGSKLLLDGFTQPANQTADVDLKVALDAIFNHPNTGPFLARGLIQHLVTSNPSPSYVYRVAQAFANNGVGVRGDLKAVIKAILTDYEARAELVTGYEGYGHLREPILRLGTMLRTFHAQAPSGKFRLWHMEDPSFRMAENPLRAPTVFNFFSPDYSLSGPVAAAGLTSPEVEIFNETSAIGGFNFLRTLLYSGYTNGGETLVLDLSQQIPIATDPAALVDQLNLLLMANSMSTDLRTTLLNTLPTISDPTLRTKAAIRLIITAPEFLVER